jgi:hypothetical protein
VSTPPTDLIATLGQAERRPGPDAGRITAVTIAGQSRLAIATDPISRITWTTAIPRGAALTVWLGVDPDGWNAAGSGVRFRIGIADDRVYEELLSRQVDPAHVPADRAWIPLRADFGRYAGFQWSLFYHPDGRQWRIILNTSGRGVTPLWAQPVIASAAR